MKARQATFGIGPKAWALFSDCTRHAFVHPAEKCHEACKGRLYRYRLAWPTGVPGDARRCLFVLANPSTANADELDPTVARCVNFATRWGFGWCWVVNVRAWRETKPDLVPADVIAIGPENDSHIFDAARAADLVVCGWGKLGGARGEVALQLIRSAGKVPYALRLNSDGSPAHPLYLPGDLIPTPMCST